jgi:hypothetical protein
LDWAKKSGKVVTPFVLPTTGHAPTKQIQCGLMKNNDLNGKHLPTPQNQAEFSKF